MQTNSQLSPVLAEKDAPAWRRWLKNMVEGDMYREWSQHHVDVHSKKVARTSLKADFCGCCGAFWFLPTPVSIYTTKQNHLPDQSTNKLGIYFGEELPAATLVQRSGLTEAVTFEIQDGKKVHSFAWKDE